MILRRQLPAYSPVPFGAVWAGLGAAVFGDPHEPMGDVLRSYFGARDVVLTDSGTAALTLAVGGALDRQPGAPVAVPAYCCYDVATAVDGARAPVLLYDVEPTTLAPDLDSLSRCLREGAAAVVVAHLFGLPLDLGPVSQLVGRTNAMIIEDAAQGSGAHLRGRPLGGLGSLAVLSFGRGKGVTSGRGGALLANDELGERALATAARRLRAPGRGWPELFTVGALWLLGHPAIYGFPSSLSFLHLGETVYRPPVEPRGASGVAAAVLSATWPLAVREAQIRRHNAERLLRALGPGLVPVRTTEGSSPGFLRLPVIASTDARAAVAAPYARRLGVMPGYPLPLNTLPGFAERCLNSHRDFPGARLLAAQLCTLPTHSRLTAPDVDQIERWVAAHSDSGARRDPSLPRTVR